MEVDPRGSIFRRNHLNYTDLIEDNFYRPYLNLLIKNKNLPKNERTYHIQASTIKLKLCSLTVFCKFLYNRGILIDISTANLKRIMSKVQELCSSLRQYIDPREQEVSQIKSKLLITTKQFEAYWNSDYVKYVNTLLHTATKSIKSISTRKHKATEVRDYLMVSMTYFNCLRTSNLINISLGDIKKIEKYSEIDGA